MQHWSTTSREERLFLQKARSEETHPPNCRDSAAMTKKMTYGHSSEDIPIMLNTIGTDKIIPKKYKTGGKTGFYFLGLNIADSFIIVYIYKTFAQ